MSTRSYVGLIEDGEVTYAYHHSDSYFEGLGIELFKGIETNADIHKIKDFCEWEDKVTRSKEEFFSIPDNDICIEFCYGFDVDTETWYVSSNHFAHASVIHKLTEVVQDDKVMKEYLECYYEQYRETILKEIRNNIK